MMNMIVHRLIGIDKNMKTPIEQAIEWCNDNMNYRSRSVKSQQEKEIYGKLKEKLESLLILEQENTKYLKQLENILKHISDNTWVGNDIEYIKKLAALSFKTP